MLGTQAFAWDPPARYQVATPGAPESREEPI